MHNGCPRADVPTCEDTKPFLFPFCCQASRGELASGSTHDGCIVSPDRSPSNSAAMVWFEQQLLSLVFLLPCVLTISVELNDHWWTQWWDGLCKPRLPCTTRPANQGSPCWCLSNAVICRVSNTRTLLAVTIPRLLYAHALVCTGSMIPLSSCSLTP